ncbi:MAG TPA: hypothetical protein VGM54_19700 [Chthoniobacter sp.]|jgi:hypothetical protein
MGHNNTPKKAANEVEVARITVTGTVIVAAITSCVSIIGTILTFSLGSKSHTQVPSEQSTPISSSPTLEASEVSEQHWLVIERIEFQPSNSLVRVVARVGGQPYSFPSSEFNAGEHQLPERFPLPVGLRNTTVQIQILSRKADGSVERFRSYDRPVDVTQRTGTISIPKWRMDSAEHPSEIVPMVVWFHFE